MATATPPAVFTAANDILILYYYLIYQSGILILDTLNDCQLRPFFYRGGDVRHLMKEACAAMLLCPCNFTAANNAGSN